MIRSTQDKLGEYELIKEPAHIARVWAALEKALPRYWKGFLDSNRQASTAGQLAAAFGTTRETLAEADFAVLDRVFSKTVDEYAKEAARYRHFFHPETLEEFQDDPGAFKQSLSRDVPVIANTLRQRRAELKEWQKHFRMCRPKELLEVFSNVLDYQLDWSERHPVRRYEEHDTPDEFELDPLDNDESMFIWNVVGMGIKSIILYHLDASRLPARGRYGLYGLYFLTGRDHFGLPSQSSEFLMVNDIDRASDGSIIMDQNYWYPYGLFSLYALRVFRWISARSAEAGYQMEPEYRFVYVDRFFQAVCDQHSADMKTMRAHERFEIPG